MPSSGGVAAEGTPDVVEFNRDIRPILMVEKHAKAAPKPAAWLEANVPEGLTVFDFPAHHRRRLRTNNGLERLNREIKRRRRVASIYPDEAGAPACGSLCLGTAVLLETDDNWQIEK